MLESAVGVLVFVNQILDAGNTITAFSLLLYAMTFNLRERVARSHALLLACITAVYFGDVLVSTAQSVTEAEVWLRLQWVGIAFVPAAYLQISDALLAATGRPSRGRRRMLVRLAYLAGTVFLVVAGVTPWLASDVVSIAGVAYLRPQPTFALFCLFYAGGLGLAGLNLWRAYRRCLTTTSRRRMRYLMAAGVAPALGAFPFLMLLNPLVGEPSVVFWGIVALTSIGVAVSLVLMAYVVAYYGVSYPDRVVKSRLFQWILRGPIVASTVLALTLSLGRVSTLLDLTNTRAVPFAMVAVLLLLQYVITLVRTPLERWLFYGVDRNDVARLHLLEDRLLTTGDLRQFMEAVLNAVCDLSDSTSAFVAAVGPAGLEFEVSVGDSEAIPAPEGVTPLLTSDHRHDLPGLGGVFVWDGYLLLPLRHEQTDEIIGLLGIGRADPAALPADARQGLRELAQKAAVALTDRRLQREVFQAVDRLVPEVEAIQRVRAAARYGSLEALTRPLGSLSPDADLAQLVREALGHYWGGPRLTQSPLLGLRVVRQSLEEHEGNPVNALRAILRGAIERTRPEGERRFTAEWVLYNILEMKFLEGRKVRDVAMRLAMSEADLYRKQRVAVEAVAQAVAEMEQVAEVREPTPGGVG
jgi:hypothetical protein